MQLEANSLINPITVKELNAAFKEVNIHKAPGPSTITYEDLKHLYPNVKEYLLVILYNQISQKGKVPDPWKNTYRYLYGYTQTFRTS